MVSGPRSALQGTSERRSCSPADAHRLPVVPRASAGGGKEWMGEAVNAVPTSRLKWASSPELAGKELLLYGTSLETSKVMPYAELCTAFD